MARPIKDTPILIHPDDIKRLLLSIRKPKSVSNKELDRRKKNFDFLESIKTF